MDDPHGDQTGPLPLPATLGASARLIADERGLTGLTGRPSAEQLAGWLEPHLDWAAGQPWVEEMYAELDAMVRTVRGITRTRPGRRPVHSRVPAARP